MSSTLFRSSSPLQEEVLKASENRKIQYAQVKQEVLDFIVKNKSALQSGMNYEEVYSKILTSLGQRIADFDSRDLLHALSYWYSRRVIEVNSNGLVILREGRSS